MGERTPRCPSWTHSRKALATEVSVPLALLVFVGPSWTHSRKALATFTTPKTSCPTGTSLVDSQPKGIGDSPSVFMHRRSWFVVPRGLTAERHWRPSGMANCKLGHCRPSWTHSRKALATCPCCHLSSFSELGPSWTHSRKALATRRTMRRLWRRWRGSLVDSQPKGIGD